VSPTPPADAFVCGLTRQLPLPQSIYVIEPVWQNEANFPFCIRGPGLPSGRGRAVPLFIIPLLYLLFLPPVDGRRPERWRHRSLVVRRSQSGADAPVRRSALAMAIKLSRDNLAQPVMGRIVAPGLMPDHVDWQRGEFERDGQDPQSKPLFHERAHT
jgi:hypothetical protein